MKKLKALIRKIIFAMPGGEALWVNFARSVGIIKPDFSGWNMITYTFPPWHNGGGDEIARNFIKVNRDIINKVICGDFKLSQYDNLKITNAKPTLCEVMWRHYIVFWSAYYASKATSCAVKNLVECGVCDGLTISFAMHAVGKEYEFKSFLYDAWEGMKDELLLEKEKFSVGDYSYLDISNTKKNLSEFSGNIVFNKGFIPDSFKISANPSELVWLHLDLNSAIPTVAALHFFYERIPPGGVILFDDYAWHGYVPTKLAIDEFFSNMKSGVLLPLPTGQAIFFKHQELAPQNRTGR